MMMTKSEIMQRQLQLKLQAVSISLAECQIKIQDAGRVLNECQNLLKQIKDEDGKL